MPRAVWTIEKVEAGDGLVRLGYRIRLTGEHGEIFEVRTSDVWPPPAAHLFAMLSNSLREGESSVEIERCNAISVSKRVGPNATTLDVVLDRGQRRRCSFLIYTNKKTGKRQVSFRTPDAVKSHKSRSYLQPASARVVGEVVVDTREKYGWKLAAEKQVREALPAGDYAARVNGRIVAVVERKTFKNMLAEISSLERYHAHLSELACYPRAALVIEAAYSDFLNPDKTRPVAADRCRRALADINALHPNLLVHFGGNRKESAIWAGSFFEACCAADANKRTPDLLTEKADESGQEVRTHQGGAWAEVRPLVLFEIQGPFTLRDLHERLPQCPMDVIRREVGKLRSEGIVTISGKGRGVVYSRVPQQ